MSWAEPENGLADSEENPNPEEDSDLPHWQDANCDRVETGQGEDEAEGNSTPSEELEARGGVSHMTDASEHSGAAGTDNDSGNSFHVSDGNEASNGVLLVNNGAGNRPTVEELDDRREVPEERRSRESLLELEGDSFEQDEETAAPECETAGQHEACSESDRQLLEASQCLTNDVLDNHHTPQQEVDQENESYIECNISDIDHNAGLVCNDNRNSHATENTVEACVCSGNVEVANNMEDVPEAEMDDLNGDCVESACVVKAHGNDIAAAISAPHSFHQSDHNEVGKCEEECSQEVAGQDATQLVHKGVSDQDLHVPECDREAVHQHGSSHGYEGATNGEAEGTAAGHAGAFECRSSENINAYSDNIPDEGCPSNPVDNININMGEVVPVDSAEPQAQFNSIPVDSESSQTLAQPHDSNALVNDSHTAHIIEHQSYDQPDYHAEGQQGAESPEIPSVSISSVQRASPISSASEQESIQRSDTNVEGEIVSNRQTNSRKDSEYETSVDSSSHIKLSSHDIQHSSNTTEEEMLTSHAMAMNSDYLQAQVALALQSDDEDDILSELDAELLTRSSQPKLPKQLTPDGCKVPVPLINGLQPSVEVHQLQRHNQQLLEQLRIRDEEIEKLTQERNAERQELQHLKSQESVSPPSNIIAEDLYLPQIKEMEITIARQQREIDVTKEKLASHDQAAKRAVTTLQHELKSRVDQVTKMYEDCMKEKDMMVVKFAESETKKMEAMRNVEKCEFRIKEVLREKDNIGSALRAAKVDKQKAVAGFDAKCHEINNLMKELEKMKEAVSSSEYRIKWFQNKLKDELESHKETKSNLEKRTARLKEAREETEMIRKECQSIVKRYQESEEIKSNSLDKELKIKESELKVQRQERNDTAEVHQMIKEELDSLKGQHKDTLEEVKTFKDKVRCLEEERHSNHQMIENYQEIMQRQKSENVDLKDKLSSLSGLEENFNRAQEMIKNLDKDISDLKITNKDLQKDMELCRERESKMLTLQSELSRSNALLRSENTNVSNKATIVTGEMEKLKMEVQELETTVKDLNDKYEEEKTKRKEEMEKMASLLAEKSKESADFKQKWEDELDNSKTLKRRHANNVKDLTRQLQQVKKKLDSAEGKGEGGSMGSRTNSNGSLNSIENSSSHGQHVLQNPAVQDFPVITEQVEVDKQVLIERIVRLQKAHARKNEKLEFLGEHIQQLLEEIKRKTKIIHSYVLREEAGTLSSDDMDANKVEVRKEMQTLLARKGGIMASVYSLHQQDGNMTLDLSLQINKKLQAVLEDTLLKNITLKENLDTLGEEIARLSQQNRKLQLHLQDLEKS